MTRHPRQRSGRAAGAAVPGGRGDGVTSARAGQPAAPGDLVDVAKLVTAYFAVHPDPGEAAQRVSFGTSGHRGSAFTATFNEDHIAATTQAICEYRAGQRHRRPAVPGRRHPRAVRARAGHRAGGARRQRRPGAVRRARRVHADPGGVPGDPGTQRVRARPAAPTGSWSPRRTTRPRTAGSSTTRRTAARPAPTSPGGSRTGPTNCSPAAWPACGGSRTRGRPRPTPPGGSTSSTPTSPPSGGPSTWPRSRRPGSASARIRSAGPASPTGARSASGTAWI